MRNKKINFWTVLLTISLLWVLYAYFTMNAISTSSTTEFVISPQMLLWIRLTIILPYLAIWIIGVYGWYGIYSYSKNVTDSTGYNNISNGVLLLLFGMVFTAVISAYRSFEFHDQSTLATLTILTNYMYAFIPLASFYLLYSGSKNLKLGLVENTSNNLWSTFFLGVITLGYVAAVFTNPNRQTPIAFDVTASYYLPDILIIFTVIAPTILGWYFGIKAIDKLSEYTKVVKGVIYQSFFSKFAKGVVWVIVSYIVLHAILSLGTTRLLDLGLLPVMVMVYLFLIALGVGFGYIRKGSSKLSQIEEI